MGGICSKGSAFDKSPTQTTHTSNKFKETADIVNTLTSTAHVAKEQDGDANFFSFSPTQLPNHVNSTAKDPRLSRIFSYKSRSYNSTKTAGTATTKLSDVASIFGRAGTVGLGKAVEVLDTLGSSMSNFNITPAFVSGVITKGNKINILAFEVANTIVKGSNLMQSLSNENIKHLKQVVLPSDAVQLLISKDMDELLRIAAYDKREEFKIFIGEVVRFGNRCKDPQWHNLDRYFEKLGSELTLQRQLKEEAKSTVQRLMVSVQYTAELYHELHALNRYEQDYRRKLQDEENLNTVQRSDNLQFLKQELKSQQKHVKSLNKKSLWSKILEEVLENLVDIVHFLHIEIHEAFGAADVNNDQAVIGLGKSHQRLGSAGLALHYANIINQIDTLVLRSSSIPPNTRDNLYQALPPSVKSAFRVKLQSFEVNEEITISQIKSEMEKTLRWLVPIANNTTKAHHGFGWVGEWANKGSEINHKSSGQTDLLRIQTLHHSSKEKTEAYMLDLVVWLHHLVSLSQSINGCIRSPIKSPIRSPIQCNILITAIKPSTIHSTLTKEDQEMLLDVKYRKSMPGISKSQEFCTSTRTRLEKNRLSKSSSHSPNSDCDKELVHPRRVSTVPIINFELDRIKALDVIDRVDNLRQL